MLKDKLHIYIITYNRFIKFKNTLKQVFAENSPLRNLKITIIDNASNDGTETLIKQYMADFPNIEYIRHEINIGGNANIARTLEIAASGKEDYFWILCDDDDYNFSQFDKIENAIISNKYDGIIVERKSDFNSNDYPYIINTITFLPAGIYKKDNLTSQVLQNAYCNIFLSFPHLALGCHLLNCKKKFFIGPQIVYQNINSDFCRGNNIYAHPRIKDVNLYSSYISSYQMIEDRKLREKCCDVLYINKAFFYFWRLKPNATNVFEAIQGLNYRQKLLLIIAFFFSFFRFNQFLIAIRLSLS